MWEKKQKFEKRRENTVKNNQKGKKYKKTAKKPQIYRKIVKN